MDTTAHHAIAFEGPTQETVAAAKRHIAETLGLSVERNPDVAHYAYERFTVDDARALKERAGQAALGKAQAFILSFDNATHEAQNALLKVLEEPGAGTFFVLCVPTRELLLPTVQSRLSYGSRVTGDDPTQEGNAFLSASIPQRLKCVEKISKDGDRPAAAKLLNQIEAALHVDPAGNAAALAEVLMASTYIRDRSSSIKQLLEHVAVSLPRN